MSQKEIARVGVYMSKKLKDRLDKKADELHKTTSALIAEWCEQKLNDSEFDVIKAIRQIEERLDALENRK